MSDADREQTIRRILVALDASPHSLAALEVAAELAADLDAEIIGIFVEDINLLRLAELPFAREVTVFSAAPRQLDRKEVERRLRSQARQARQALAAIAAKAQLRWSFQVAQGLIEAELLAAAQESDLILVGKAGWSRRRRLGSTARVIVAQAPNQIMVIQEGAHLGLPVGVLYDGSDLARKALAAAMNLLRDQEGFLTLMIVADSVEKARQLQSQALQQVRPLDLHVHFRWLIHTNVPRMAEFIHLEHCGVLVVPGEGEILDEDTLVDLLDRIACPVLLIR